VDTLEENEHVLRKASMEIGHKDAEIESKSRLLKQSNAEIDEFKSRRTKFAATGKEIEEKALKRFSKVALFDTSGEFLGWIPIIGDAASIGLTAGGIYQMCQMFKEIEAATIELGVPYRIYTDTFCEKPVGKTKEVIVEKTGEVKGKIVATTTVFTEYVSSVPTPDTEALSAKIHWILDRAYDFIARLFNDE